MVSWTDSEFKFQQNAVVVQFDLDYPKGMPFSAMHFLKTKIACCQSCASVKAASFGAFASRVLRVRGYGDGINAEVATAFIEEYMRERGIV